MASGTWYVDPDAPGPTHNGTSWNDAYLTLAAAVSGQAANLTGTGPAIFECRASSGTADASNVSISGYTTTAADYIEIRCSGAARHAGVWDATKYHLSAVGGTSGLIQIFEDYVRIDGIQVDCQTAAAASYGIYLPNGGVGAANDIRISNCIVKSAGNAGQIEGGININDSDAIAYIWNCIVYGTSANASSIGISGGAGASVNVYSCTVQGGNFGIRNGAASSFIAKNCYASGASTKSYSGSVTQTTCASSDATATEVSLRNIALNTTNFLSATPGEAGYLLLPSSGSALLNVGTDTSGSSAPLNFTTDIQGDTRSGTWDVGADEYVETGVIYLTANCHEPQLGGSSF